MIGRGAQDGMEHHDDRCRDTAEKREYFFAVPAAIDAVLMLQDDHVAVVELPDSGSHRHRVTGDQVAPHMVPRGGRWAEESGRLIGVDQPDDGAPVAPDRVDQLGRQRRGERRKPADGGRVGADEAEAQWTGGGHGEEPFDGGVTGHGDKPEHSRHSGPRTRGRSTPAHTRRHRSADPPGSTMLILRCPTHTLEAQLRSTKLRAH